MLRNILAIILGIIVGIALIGGIMAMGMNDGPDWMVIELPLYLLVAWAAGRIVISQTNGDNQLVNQT
jgi:predicted membrane channel-forming protein YqfA (hemolysin III family)